LIGPRKPGRDRHTGLVTPVLLWCVLAAAIGSTAGCFYQRVKAKYELPEKITLVLVDDPAEALGDPYLAQQVANQISFQLVQNKAVPATVPLNRLSELRRRLGAQYATTPIDEVGRTLDAQQVIHVEIIAARTGYEPGVDRPTAQARVKVIDVEQRQRLWPAPGRGGQTGPSGYSLTSKMFYRYQSDRGERGAGRDLAQRFATHIGQDVAKLFYDHEPDIGQSRYRDD